MYEYDFFDGDHFITFDIVEIDDENNTILVAISNQGRITQDTFDLLEDEALTKYAKTVTSNSACIKTEYISTISSACKEISLWTKLHIWK